MATHMDGGRHRQQSVSDEKGEWTRHAIDVMTAWSDRDGKSLVADRFAEYVGASPDGAVKLSVGFINLSAILLVLLQEASGADSGAILQDAARLTL